jgi:hypothetical protein
MFLNLMDTPRGNTLAIYASKRKSLAESTTTLGLRVRPAVRQWSDAMAYPSVGVVVPHSVASNDIATINGSLAF